MASANDVIYAKRSDESIPTVLLSVFVFQNLFNAYSPYITLAINLLIAVTILFRHGGSLRQIEPVVIATAYFVLAWLLLVTAYRGGDADLVVLLKYVRVALSVTLFVVIFAAGGTSATAIVRAVNLSLAFHVLLVLAQIAVPDLTFLTAPFFGFEREISILEGYSLRKLGASSGYDTASLLSIAALLFFYMQFAQGKGSRYLVLAVVAFVASLMSSRTGIALSLVIVSVICLRTLLGGSWTQRAAAFGAVAVFFVVIYEAITLLLLHSLGISELRAGDAELFFSETDYGTTGTLEALTDTHLQPLHAPLIDLLIGYGIDPNMIARYTDIGYVKLIYHVGIVGTASILLAHIYILVVTRNFSFKAVDNSDRKLICQFLFWLIAISIAFNYKSLQLHSRGIGDFIYMLFLFLAQSSVQASRGLSTRRQSVP